MKANHTPPPQSPLAHAGLPTPDSAPLRLSSTLLEVRSSGPTTVIGFRPEVHDLSNREEVSTLLLRELTGTLHSLEPRPERVILSLEGIQYLGSNPIAVIFEVHSGSRADPPRYPPIALADVAAEPLRKINTVGLSKVIPTYPTVADALNTRPPPSHEAA